MNEYKLPNYAFNRKYEQTISTEYIKDKLVGDKSKELVIVDDMIELKERDNGISD